MQHIASQQQLHILHAGYSLCGCHDILYLLKCSDVRLQTFISAKGWSMVSVSQRRASLRCGSPQRLRTCCQPTLIAALHLPPVGSTWI